jgi:hypothetical protein
MWFNVRYRNTSIFSSRFKIYEYIDTEETVSYWTRIPIIVTDIGFPRLRPRACHDVMSAFVRSPQRSSLLWLLTQYLEQSTELGAFDGYHFSVRSVTFWLTAKFLLVLVSTDSWFPVPEDSWSYFIVWWLWEPSWFICNFLTIEVPINNINNSVRASQETHLFSIPKPNRLMLFGETAAVYCENHMEHIHTLCGKNAETLYIRIQFVPYRKHNTSPLQSPTG